MTVSRRITLPALLVAAGALLALPYGTLRADDQASAADEISPSDRLMTAWWETAAMIGRGKPWAACRDHLAAGLERFPDADPSLIPLCRALVEDLALAIDRPATLPATPVPNDIEVLIRSLSCSNIEFWLVNAPARFYGTTYAWDAPVLNPEYLSDDPANQLFRIGRPTIPALIQALEDRTPTRCVQANPEAGMTPRVARVGDVALALIEGISMCRLHGLAGQDLFISRQSPQERAALIDRIHNWWEKTADMTPTDAVVWTIQHNPPTLRDSMLDALIARGDREAAVHCLLDLYISNDDLNPQMAPRLVRAGSRAPLEYVHRVVADGRPLTRNMLRIVTDYGNIEDLELLCRYVAGLAGPGDRAADAQVNQIVDVLRYNDRVEAIPVLVTVLNRHVSAFAAIDPGRVPIPRYVNQAADRVQSLSGVAFGYHSGDGAERCFHVIRRMLEWWNEEGRAVYGLEQSRPHGPDGIQ